MNKLILIVLLVLPGIGMGYPIDENHPLWNQGLAAVGGGHYAGRRLNHSEIQERDSLIAQWILQRDQGQFAPQRVETSCERALRETAEVIRTGAYDFGM